MKNVGEHLWWSMIMEEVSWDVYCLANDELTGQVEWIVKEQIQRPIKEALHDEDQVSST